MSIYIYIFIHTCTAACFHTPFAPAEASAGGAWCLAQGWNLWMEKWKTKAVFFARVYQVVTRAGSRDQ